MKHNILRTFLFALPLCGAACGTDDPSAADENLAGNAGTSTAGNVAATAGAGAAGAGASGAGASGAGASGAGASGAGAAGAATATDENGCLIGGELVLTDDTNYTFSNTIEIETVTLKDATDLIFDWSAVTLDMFKRPIDVATDVELGLITLWGMTPAELQENIRIDNLPLGSNKGFSTTYPEGGATSQNLKSFDILGAELPEEDLWSRFDTSSEGYQYPQDTHTFMFMISSNTQLGKNARMMSFFNLDPASDNTELRMTNDSTKLEYEVDLQQGRAIKVQAGDPDITVDWGDMTLNALGNTYRPTQINEAVVAHYPNHTLAQLEEDFLDLEAIADGWWKAEIGAGVSVDLATLADADGNTFPGIDDQGTWLIALFCTANCNNPAPWSLTKLETCGP